MAVLLLVLACGGEGDGFEPAPGAALDQDELEGLMDAALADFDLQKRAVQHEPLAQARGGLSCFEVESGPCSVPRPPGLAAAFEGNDGTRVLVRLTLGLDELEAGDLVDQAIVSKGHEATAMLRTVYESKQLPGSFVSGPCDEQADGDSDEGCAWQERDAPGVGDQARAMKSVTLETTRLSAVAFSRAFVAAEVDVVAVDGKVSDSLADDIAEALDEQIKAALSR